MEKDAYIGRYLREFDKQLEGVDLRSALQAAEAHYDFADTPRDDPEGDARDEAGYWREAA